MNRVSGISPSRWLVAAILLAALLAYAVAGGRHALSLDALGGSIDAARQWRRLNPWSAAASFLGLYVGATALSLPVASALSLAAGAVFGWIEGSVLVSFGASIGATLAFLASRFVFGAAVRARFGPRMQAIEEGLHKDGAFYLFTLRLVPVLPFFVINLLAGLTRIRVRTFYLASQLGMLPATLVYANAGTHLAGLRVPGDLFSPGLVAALALLGIFPLVARRAARAVRARRILARWPRPARFDRNLVVIGAGAAGLVSAYIAAAVKARVTLVESAAMGGDCLNSGCVPSKALIRAAQAASEARAAHALGVTVDAPRVDFAAVMAHVRSAVAAVAPHDSVERYRALGVDVRRGHARIVSPWVVEIDGERLTTRSIVIAAGARPFVPPLPGLEAAGYLTSDTLWQLDALPRRLLVLGGGPIGCELAQAFARLGVDVTLVEMAERLLAREDDDISALAADVLRGDGVDVRVAHRALVVEPGGDEGGHVLRCASAGGTVQIDFDRILVAVGRQPRLDGYGLEELGIPTRRTIDTDAYLATVYPNIYACGDVAGPYQFTHAGAHQAWYATVNALFGGLRRFAVDYRVMPAVTFLDPEIARVGVNEREATAAGVAYETTRFDLGELDRALVERRTTGWVKLLTVPGKDRLLGATVVGAHAGELIAELALAMRHGLGLNRILATVHAYPTWSEANKYAAGAWRREHAPQRLLHLAGRYHAWRRRDSRPPSGDSST